VKKSGQFLTVFLVTAVFLTLNIACSIPGLGDSRPGGIAAGPVVTISSPTSGQDFQLGSQVEILSSAVDPQGIVRTELVVDGEVVWVDANADPQPEAPFIVAQPWTPAVRGSHVIQVTAYNADNVPGSSAPLTVNVAAPAAQTVEEAEATAQRIQPERRASTDTPVPVLADAPTAMPTLPATATPALPSPTPTPAPPTFTPTATPTPGVYAPTGLEPEGRFEEIWRELGGGESRLGYPTEPESDDRDFAKQYFENGVMYWWDNPDEPDYIWVIDSPAADLRSGRSSNRYADEWDGDDEISCDAARANNGQGPLRGFGWLWCHRPELQTRLGNPVEPEAGSGGTPPFGRVLMFQGGIMLYNPLNSEVYVLFDQGDWQRIGW
jgi:hypothetical protein